MKSRLRLWPCLLGLAFAWPVQAVIVTTGADSGLGSLREAVREVAHGGVIDFAPGVDVVELSSGKIEVAKSLTIQGPAGGVTIRASSAEASSGSRIFDASGSPLILKNLTIEGGRVSGDSGGGAIMNHGSLVMERCVVRNNRAEGVGGGAHVYGGAIYNMGDVVLRQCTFQSNHVRSDGAGAHNYGGAIYCLWGTSLRIDGCTFEGNSVTAYHAAGGAVCASGALEVINSTFSGNRSREGGALYVLYPHDVPIKFEHSTITGNVAEQGGGIYFLWPIPNQRPFLVRSNIIAGNSSPDGADIYNLNRIESAGHNIIGDVQSSSAPHSGFIVAPTDRIGVTAAEVNLGPLALNGGPTRTHALRRGSVAIDTGDDAHCPPTDQRGEPRPQGGHCDAGAYEAGADPGDSVTPSAVICADPAGGEVRFGAGIGTDVDTLFVGAPEEVEPAPPPGVISPREGAVRVYYRQGNDFNQWREHQVLRPSGGGHENTRAFGGNIVFAHSNIVAIGFETRLGDAGETQEKVAIFERGTFDPDWGPTEILGAPITIGERAVMFPGAFSLSDDTAVIGMLVTRTSTDPPQPRGMVFVFDRRADGTWADSSRVQPDDPDDSAEFGAAVHSIGDFLMVGDPGASNGAGAAYLFVRDRSPGPTTGRFIQKKKFVSPVPRPGGNFGRTVLSNGQVIIGEPAEDAGPNAVGRVYRFERDIRTGEWNAGEELAPNDPTPGGRFGISLALDGNNRDIIVGQLPAAASTSAQKPGAAYVFHWGAHGWRQRWKLAPTLGQSPDGFGFPVAAGSLNLAVGDYAANGGAGCVYIYDLRMPNRPPLFLECPSDLEVEANGSAGAEVTLKSHAVDEDGDDLFSKWEVDGVVVRETRFDGGWPFTHAEEKLVHVFPPGAHVVRLTIHDRVHPPIVCEATIRVADNMPPEIRRVRAMPAALKDLRGRFVPVRLVVDAVDASGPVTWRIISVSSSEPPPRGRRDWVIAPGGHFVFLRARCDHGNRDRTYTITVRASDAAGNQSTADTTVMVHCQSPPKSPAFRPKSSVIRR